MTLVCPSQLIYLDSFEPFRGTVSGSCGIYAFKEFLQSRKLPGTPVCVTLGDLWQYVLSVHQLLTVAFVKIAFWFERCSGSSLSWILPTWRLLTHTVTPEIVLSKLALVTGLSLYDKEGCYLGHLKSVTALDLHFTFHHNCFQGIGGLETLEMMLQPAVSTLISGISTVTCQCLSPWLC